MMPPSLDGVTRTYTQADSVINQTDVLIPGNESAVGVGDLTIPQRRSETGACDLFPSLVYP
jgi:hypothetical protein